MSIAAGSAKIEELHPEMKLGGYMAYDGTIEFYSRVKAVIRGNDIVVDLGAGRAAWFEEDTCTIRRQIRTIRGHVQALIGCDVDTAVLANRSVDDVRIHEFGKPLPFPDESVDAVVCDYVLEHVSDPGSFVKEVERILKPGGWFCARTPTKYNYVSLAARFVSNAKHAKLLRRVQPGRKSEDVFPTSYRLNTLSDLRRSFPTSRFENFSYLYTSEPHYHFGNPLLYRALCILHRLLPSSLVGNIFAFLRKR